MSHLIWIYRDCLDEGSQDMVLKRNKNNYPSFIIRYPLLQLRCYSTHIFVLSFCFDVKEQARVVQTNDIVS